MYKNSTVQLSTRNVNKRVNRQKEKALSLESDLTNKNKIIDELEESNVILNNKLTSALRNTEKYRKKFYNWKSKAQSLESKLIEN